MDQIEWFIKATRFPLPLKNTAIRKFKVTLMAGVILLSSGAPLLYEAPPAVPGASRKDARPP